MQNGNKSKNLPQKQIIVCICLTVVVHMSTVEAEVDPCSSYLLQIICMIIGTTNVKKLLHLRWYERSTLILLFDTWKSSMDVSKGWYWQSPIQKKSEIPQQLLYNFVFYPSCWHSRLQSKHVTAQWWMQFSFSLMALSVGEKNKSIVMGIEIMTASVYETIVHWRNCSTRVYPAEKYYSQKVPKVCVILDYLQFSVGYTS